MHKQLASYSLKEKDAITIWHRHWNGEYQNRIAADLDVNPGRVNEVIKERKFIGSKKEAHKTYTGNSTLQ